MRCEHGFVTQGSDAACSGACPIAVARSYSDEDMALAVRALRKAVVEYVIAIAVGNPVEEPRYQYVQAKLHVEGMLNLLDDQVYRARDK